MLCNRKGWLKHNNNLLQEWHHRSRNNKEPDQGDLDKAHLTEIIHLKAMLVSRMVTTMLATDQQTQDSSSFSKTKAVTNQDKTVGPVPDPTPIPRGDRVVNNTTGKVGKGPETHGEDSRGIQLGTLEAGSELAATAATSIHKTPSCQTKGDTSLNIPHSMEKSSFNSTTALTGPY